MTKKEVILIVVAILIGAFFIRAVTTYKETEIMYVGPYTARAYEAAKLMLETKASPVGYTVVELESAYKIVEGQK